MSKTAIQTARELRKADPPSVKLMHSFDRRYDTELRDARQTALANHTDIVLLSNAIPCLDCRQYVRNPDGECTGKLLARFRAA